MNAAVSSFILVAASEMGDKTQILALALATRFKKPWAIMAGILTATVLNHSLAAWAGQWVSARVPENVLRRVLAATFIGFSLWILKPDDDVDEGKNSPFGPFLATTVAFFLAEMGDKTQLATVGLAARFHNFFQVTAGTTLGMLFSDGLVVFFGKAISRKIPMPWIRRAAAGIFFAFGLAVLFLP